MRKLTQCSCPHILAISHTQYMWAFDRNIDHRDPPWVYYYAHRALSWVSELSRHSILFITDSFIVVSGTLRELSEHYFIQSRDEKSESDIYPVLRGSWDHLFTWVFRSRVVTHFSESSSERFSCDMMLVWWETSLWASFLKYHSDISLEVLSIWSLWFMESNRTEYLPEYLWAIFFYPLAVWLTGYLSNNTFFDSELWQGSSRSCEV